MDEDTVAVIFPDWPEVASRTEPYDVGYYEWPTLAARPEQLRAAYMRYGAIFEADSRTAASCYG